MKNLTLSSMIICALCMVGCQPKQQNSVPLTSGIDTANLDFSADPKVDFYQYACGGWMKNNPLKDEYARFGSFDQLGENNKERLQQLIRDLSEGENAPGSIAQKIGDLYNMGMDSSTINQQGATPLQTELQQIANLKSKTDLTGQLVQMGLCGDYPLLAIFGEADPKDSKMTIAWLYQNGLGIGDRDYYLEQDQTFKGYRESYVKMLSEMFDLSGYSQISNFKGKEKAMAEQVLAFETCLAEISMPKEILRDPEKTYNMKTIDELQTLIPALDLKSYLTGLGLKDLKTVNAATLSYFEKLNTVIEKTDWQTLKNYLAAQTIIGAANFLSDDFSNAKFDFYGRVLSGKKEQQPRWKRVLQVVEGSLGEAMGKMYVEKYFPAADKQRMLNLVENLRFALSERVKKNTWMTDITKRQAIDKLATFRVKIGYPDKWRDFSGLDIHADSYYANVQRASIFNTRYALDKIGKPVDPDEWHMTPQTVNAYYNPTTNEICFPAGILQPPFFNPAADDAANYGAIGVVIGHEMTHGFDDQGCKFDKEGNMNNWWLPADSAAFNQRTKILLDWFNKIEVLQVDGKPLYANGQFTLGENIADNGGLNISFEAMQKALREGKVNKEKMDNFTPEQRFFLAYALVWAGNVRDSEIIRRTKEDPHSLGKWRVDGTLPHVTPFLEAFDIKEGDPMFLAPEQRAEIW
ncbi:MAG: M13 family metallopeptidase [Bacteroidales bacterium]|jgi:putative endopeptidase|nr:M13 family metallopeptidase [Bacteroidales bacterium]